MRTMLKSKIHRARVTQANLDYEGSITIDKSLMEASDILPFERVEVLNINNGARLSTYAIEGEANSGAIEINGAAARLVAKGDLIIILSYCQVPDNEAMAMTPTRVYADGKNRIIGMKESTAAKMSFSLPQYHCEQSEAISNRR